jgi:MYXO-CTERM domain-containing protein
MKMRITIGIALGICLCVPQKVNAQACGNISSIGCCDTDSSSKYCDGTGKLVTKDCSKETTYKQCGWYSNKYQCTNSTASDPNSKYPRLCSALPDGGPIPVPDTGIKTDKGKTPCGNIGYTGCCENDTTKKYCSSTSGLVTSTCSGAKPSCGWDSTNNYYTCTTSTGSDPSSKYPRLCSALPDGGIADPDKGTKKDTGSTTACGSITSKGCCDGEVAKYCSSGSLKSKDCNVSPNTPSCGWNPTVGYTCGTAGGADPAGTYPKACGAITTDSGTTIKDLNTTADKSVVKQDKGTTAKSDDGCTYGGPGPMQGALALLALIAVGALLVIRRRR